MTPDELRALRESLMLSQQDLAERINEADPLLRADRNIVSRWERGIHKPSRHAEAAICQVLESRKQFLGRMGADDGGFVMRHSGSVQDEAKLDEDDARS